MDRLCFKFENLRKRQILKIRPQGQHLENEALLWFHTEHNHTRLTVEARYRNYDKLVQIFVFSFNRVEKNEYDDGIY